MEQKLAEYVSTGHVIKTGPVSGVVALGDGTRYDVSDEFIEVASTSHAGELSHQIGLLHEQDGHRLHLVRGHADYDPLVDEFHHVCSAHCGGAARSTKERVAQFNDRLRRLGHGDLIDTEDHAALLARLTLNHAETKFTGTMALASAVGENAALNGLDGTGSTNTMGFGSLHVATPGITGASENANVSSYARQAATYNAASAGSKSTASTETYTTAGTIPVTHTGRWNSATYGAGNYSIGAALNAQVTAVTITLASGAVAFTAA